MSSSPAEDAVKAYSIRYRLLIEKLKAALPIEIVLDGKTDNSTVGKMRAKELEGMLKAIPISALIKVRFADEEHQNNNQEKGFTEAESAGKTQP